MSVSLDSKMVPLQIAQQFAIGVGILTNKIVRDLMYKSTLAATQVSHHSGQLYKL